MATETFPVTVLDSFGRVLSGEWGISDSGHTWTGAGPSETQWSVDGFSGRFTVRPTDTTVTEAITVGPFDINHETLMKFSTSGSGSASNPTADTNFGPILRAVGSTYYVARIQAQDDSIQLVVSINGSWTTLATATFDFGDGIEYWVRFRVSGGVYAKVWKYGVAEPTAWTLTSPLSTASGAPPSGQAGIVKRRTAETWSVAVDQFYGYTLSDSSPTTMPVIDTFERNVDVGWGLNDNGQPWEGSVAYDPRILGTSTGVGNVGDGFGRLIHNGDGFLEQVAMTGPVVAGNVESLVKFKFNFNASQGRFRIGARGNYQVASNVLQHTGYALIVAGGATTLELVKKTTMSGVYSTVTPTTNTAFTAISSVNTYWVRFQITGTTLQARIWQDGSVEPSTWHFVATDSSLTSGRAWLGLGQLSGTTTARTVSIAEYSYSQTVTGTISTTTGTLSTTAITDTSLAVRASFTNDSNATNSVNVRYRPVGSSTWSTFAGTKTRVASPLSWTFTITGLTKNTAYQVEVTFVDPEGVTGTNPRISTFTTTYAGATLLGVAVTAVTPTSVTIQASYEGDSNNTSSATVQYRQVSKEFQPINDSFTDSANVLLQNHVPELGEAWVRHTSVIGCDVAIWRGQLYAQANDNTERGVYYNDFVIPVSEFEVYADILYRGLGNVGLLGRVETATANYYEGGYDDVNKQWRIVKYVAGSATVLATLDAVLTTDEFYRIGLVIRNNAKQLVVDGTVILSVNDNTLTAGTRAGIRMYPGEVAAADEQNIIDNLVVTYRTIGGSFSSALSMTADRTAKTFTRNVTGLSNDTAYEFLVTLNDSSGTYGLAPTSVTAMTTGNAVALSTLVSISRETSVVLETTYLHDNNNNSAIVAQYRPIYDYLWTTVSPTLITVNRSSKKFTTTIVSLRPNTTYEVKVIADDPDGIIEGTSESLSGLVTTKGPTLFDRKQGKSYLWKVFDKDGNYLTTWHDAGEPEFAWHENGGVSDLTVTLPRKISEVNTYRSGISHQNRVDVWCIDPSSEGFGPNLAVDGEFTQGAWTLGSNALIVATGGPDDSSALRIMSSIPDQIVTRGGAIYLYRQPTGDTTKAYPIPLVLKSLAKATGGKITMFVEAYDKLDAKIDTSDTVDTVGSDWQTIKLEYTPPAKATYIRVCFRNDNRGTMFADKVEVHPKESLIYRGRIETINPRIEQDGEDITIEVLGLVSLLSDDYIEFLQFVATQPTKDFEAGRRNFGPADPADMLKKIIDMATKQNPAFDLYYTAESIRYTGRPVEYTFRDQQIRACFDKVRNLCPSGWHYYIEPDGLVNLRGPEHVVTYRLRLGVEIMNFSVDRSIRNLKNFVEVKGRQDEDESEPDGHGSIKYITFDQESIDKYGKRMLFIRDSNITDPDTAELIGDGRLEEYNREEQRATCFIPDEKSIQYVSGALRGANIEAFRPGDYVIIFDPVAGPQNTYWDQMLWDTDAWDANTFFTILPDVVPIKTIQFSGTHATVELSERQPSSVGDFGRLYRWLQLQDSDKSDS